MQRAVASLSQLSKSKNSLFHIVSKSATSISELGSRKNSSTRRKLDWFTQLKPIGIPIQNSNYVTISSSQMPKKGNPRAMSSSDFQSDVQDSKRETESVKKLQIGENVSRKDKVKFLVKTLLDLKESKEAVYGALDVWVAWEQNFPIASLKRALIVLEKGQEWHRIVQVIKWILSKGQGTTMGTYEQLIRALDMDDRAEEAHNIWVKKIGNDLHSVPWKLCRLMISIYYRNNMLDRLIALFKGLEAFDRKPPEKSVIQKVANAYEMLGLVEEQQRVLDKYNYLFDRTWNDRPQKSKKESKKKTEKLRVEKQATSSENLSSDVDDAQAC